jgi:hypothetical protein
MDVPSMVLDLISRDVVLNGVLDTGPGPARRDPDTGGPVPQTCFIVLRWAADDRTGAPDGSHRLTAEAYLPRTCTAEHLFLDFLLERLWAVLAKGEADGLIAAERQCASPELVDSGSGSISKMSRFVVRPGKPRAMECLERQAPCTGPEDEPHSSMERAVGGAVPGDVNGGLVRGLPAEI